MRNPADDARGLAYGRAAVPEGMPFIVFALDAEGVFTASEGEGLASLGLKPGEVVGRSAFEVYRGVPAVLDNLDRALSGESFSSVVEVEDTTFRCRYDPLRDAGGEVIGAVGLAAEAERLSRSAAEARMKERAVAASSEGIVVTDPNRPDVPVLKNYKKDGTMFCNELSVSPVYDERGNLLNYVGVQKDVTERVRHEEELRESEERFRMTFEAAGVGMAHVAPDGRWLRINGKLAEITGYRREELLERTFQDITHPDDLEKDLEHVRRMMVGEIDGYSMQSAT